MPGEFRADRDLPRFSLSLIVCGRRSRRKAGTVPNFFDVFGLCLISLRQRDRWRGDECSNYESARSQDGKECHYFSNIITVTAGYGSATKMLCRASYITGKSGSGVVNAPHRGYAPPDIIYLVFNYLQEF
jgi:hypothetical protein